MNTVVPPLSKLHVDVEAILGPRVPPSLSQSFVPRKTTQGSLSRPNTVSYTHLDVYKRQQ